MGNLGDELKGSLNRLGITRQVEAVGVVERAQQEIGKFIPADDFEIISFKDGVLKIGTESTIVNSEIRLRETELKEKIAEKDLKRFVYKSKQTEKELF